MKNLQVGEFKAKFSEVLEDVKNGESIEIVYGKSKRPVARIVPVPGSKKKKERKFGVLEGKVKYVIADDFKMTEEELLGLK
jgi:prevent-host-death family protein